MKKVIIHCGLHKTATTSIQKTCLDFKDQILNVGLLYPSFGHDKWFNHSIPLSLLFMDNYGKRNHSVTSLFCDEAKLVENRQKIIDRHLNELQSNEQANLLLSGEDISLFFTSELINLKSFYENNGFNEFQIIVYVRNPVHYCLSGSQELVRAGVMSLSEVFGIGNLQQAQLKIRRVIDVFGRSNLNVYSYDEVLDNYKDVAVHFCKKIGLIGMDLQNSSSSASMTLEKTLVLSTAKYLGYTKVKELERTLVDKGNRIIPTNFLYEKFETLNLSDLVF